MQEKHPDFLKEKEWLTYIIDYLRQYNESIANSKQKVDKLLEESLKKYDPDNLEQYYELTLNTTLQSTLDQRTKMSKKSLLKPYFARVDFKAADENSNKPYYIGKMSLIRDEDNVPLVIDWRAPVAILYYEGRIGEASYECPDGIIAGEINLKRQYMIENAELNEFFDIDVTASDEFLQVALGSSKDKRLKDIVSTIQAEQNQIIRADMHKPVIVQGAAGGGKTTIALHRIAYLLYNYETRISPANIMILAPNRFFLSYISEVLPDLGVENVLQTTMEDFACFFTDTKLKIRPSSDKLAFLIKNPNYFNAIARVAKIKSSMIYRRIIDFYVKKLAERMLPQSHFMLSSYVLFEHKKLRRLFCEDYDYLPIEKRINEVKKYLVNTLQKRKPEILDEINSLYDNELRKIKKDMPEDNVERRAKVTALLDKRDDEIKLIQKQSATLVKDYFRAVVCKTAEDYYYDFINDEELFNLCAENYMNADDVIRVRKQSLQACAGKHFESEDIAPIMYIHSLFYGNGSLDLRHIVIDEAQDVGLFQMYVLRRIMNSNSFSILGDLCQGIYSYHGITDWNDVSSKIFNYNARFMTLEQSYRTTVEIMEFANTASSKLELKDTPLSKPVIRHGREVVVELLDSMAEIAEHIGTCINDYIARGHNSIAVVCKTHEELELLQPMIDNPQMQVISGRDDNYSGGIVLVPCYLAKGLEFDGVIVANAGSDVYGLTDLDIKLLYIAMTRALHELTVYARWELSPVLVRSESQYIISE